MNTSINLFVSLPHKLEQKINSGLTQLIIAGPVNSGRTRIAEAVVRKIQAHAAISFNKYLTVCSYEHTIPNEDIVNAPDNTLFLIDDLCGRIDTPIAETIKLLKMHMRHYVVVVRKPNFMDTNMVDLNMFGSVYHTGIASDEIITTDDTFSKRPLTGFFENSSVTSILYVRNKVKEKNHAQEEATSTPVISGILFDMLSRIHPDNSKAFFTRLIEESQSDKGDGFAYFAHSMTHQFSPLVKSEVVDETFANGNPFIKFNYTTERHFSQRDVLTSNVIIYVVRSLIDQSLWVCIRRHKHGLSGVFLLTLSELDRLARSLSNIGITATAELNDKVKQLTE